MSRFTPAPNFDELVEQATEPQLVQKAGDLIDLAGNLINNRTGRERSSLRVNQDSRGVVAESTSSFFHLIEYGSANNSPQAPLRQAADTVGRFKER